MKFAVGEICEAWSKKRSAWFQCEVTALPGHWPPAPSAYEITVPGIDTGTRFGNRWLADESILRKRGDASEDPALTRIKKLLKQDQPKPVRVHG